MNQRTVESLLQRIARTAMEERGMATDLNEEQKAQLDAIDAPASGGGLADLTSLLWCSIDNDDSLDLDQLTVYQRRPAGYRILIAVADVDALIPKDSPLDQHACQNTTSVYTAPQIFYMLPEKLTTDLTSLNLNVNRVAIIIQADVGPSGQVTASDVSRGLVRNHARLSYNRVGQWLEDRIPTPQDIASVTGMDEQLRVQDEVAQLLRQTRLEHGALEFETLEARAVMSRGDVVDLQLNLRNPAKQLIEDFMIAANGATARFLVQRGSPSLRRVVRTPKRWDRMVELAAERKFNLPTTPDSKALADFLKREQGRDPMRFPDLSLTIIKLMGPGEYDVEVPGQTGEGHFGLAVKDYSHSTAPNRRYPDLITHRLLKASIAGQPCPYSIDALQELAKHCTERENDAQKVERRVQKSAAAMLLSHHIGEYYDALVTGANDSGRWVRLLHPPVEGKLVGDHGQIRLDVGDRLRVKLVHTDVERGFIDFARVS